MSEYQEEVLTELLDLQAELRGDEPEPRDERVTPEPGDTVTVAERDVAVSAKPTPLPLNERLAALNERLSQLEHELAGVTKRIERIEPSRSEEPPPEQEGDVDARWRSFLDLQKIVADRLDKR